MYCYAKNLSLTFLTKNSLNALKGAGESQTSAIFTFLTASLEGTVKVI